MHRTNDSIIIGIAFINSATASIVILALSFGDLSSLQVVLQAAALLFAILSMISLVMCLKLLLRWRSSREAKDAPELLRDVSFLQMPDDRKYLSLFQRADVIVREQKLYLSQKYSIIDLAQTLGTNRTDLSTAFKKCTPGGFCRYINGYRLEYAVSLMNENPDLMVEEVSSRSGFSSSNTFGARFKDYMNGVTPRDYLVDLRASRSRTTARREPHSGPGDRPGDLPEGRPERLQRRS